MGSFNRLSYIASSGDLAVNDQKSSGDPIFTTSKTAPYNVRSGEIVVFDPKRNEALDDGDIATAEHISIAVGVGPEGDVAKELRYIAGEDINLCDFKIDATGVPPACGFPQVVDVFFDGVVCDDAVTLTVFLDDHLVRSRYNFNEEAKYIFTVVPECEDCSSCDTEANGDSVRDNFVSLINGTYDDDVDPTKIVRFQNRDVNNQYQPFRTLPLFNSDNSLQTFCISPQDETCEQCVFVEGITGATIDGTSYDFTYTTKAGDSTKTLRSQVDRVVEELQRALEEEAGADLEKRVYVSEGIANCCDYTIVVSWEGDVSFNTDSGSIEPCDQDNPFDGATYTHGFRFLVDPVSVECLCDFPPDDRPNYFGRTISAEFVGDGWACDQTESIERQKQVLPEGFGYFWQDEERYQHFGGSGKDYRNSDRYSGKTYVRPDKWSRTMSTTIDCEQSYCMYFLKTIAEGLGKYNNAKAYFNTSASTVLVPERDSTTRTDWELYLNALYSRGVCVSGNITCDVTPVEAQSVSVEPEAAAVTHPDTVQLTAYVFPSDADQSGTWDTSDGGVATVDGNGLVTTVGAGTATITFTSDDGGFTDSAVITVS